jgi:hypothetical protein
MDLLGNRSDLVLGEAAEGVLDQREVGIEVARPLLAAQPLQILGGAVGTHEVGGVAQGARLDPPRPLTQVGLRRHVAHGVGDEGAGNAGLGLAPQPVVEDGAGVLDGGSSMGQVVGHHLVGVDVAGRSQVPRAVVHHGPSQVDGGGSGGEVRCGGQGAESYRRPLDEEQQRRGELT